MLLEILVNISVIEKFSLQIFRIHASNELSLIGMNNGYIFTYTSDCEFCCSEDKIPLY